MRIEKKRYLVFWIEYPAGVWWYITLDDYTREHLLTTNRELAHKFTYKQASKIRDDCNRDSALGGWLPKYQVTEA